MKKRARSENDFEKRKIEIMESCFDCYCENGFNGTGIKQLAKSCGCTSANLYVYFENLDDLIIQSTAYCMSKVEDDFMERAPKNAQDIERFINEIPYWTAKKHGKKYRLMYQVYTHPKYREYGKQFFKGVDQRYSQYAQQLESQIGIPADILRSMIFVLIRACVHFALFEDEVYLQDQLKLLKLSIQLFIEKFNSK